jgi:hypothetical protein
MLLKASEQVAGKALPDPAATLLARGLTGLLRIEPARLGWTATMNLSGVAAIILAGSEESEAA